MKLRMFFATMLALAATPLLAQGELVLGYLTAETGPFVSLSRTNEMAARLKKTAGAIRIRDAFPNRWRVAQSGPTEARWTVPTLLLPPRSASG